jgi:hypothetical protein
VRDDDCPDLPAIRVARDVLTLDCDFRAMDFVSFYSRNLRSMGRDNYLDMGLVCRLIEAALLKKRGILFSAHDEAGNPTASILFVWDNGSYYS